MATPNLVPRADSEGGIGTASKYWASAYIDLIYVGAGKIGRDADNLLDFSVDNEVTFRVNAADEMVLGASTLSPHASDGLALGTSSLMWSDLFLASGAVINFDNSNLTLTHSSNALTLADSDVLAFGADGDLQLLHDATNSHVVNYLGDLKITNNANDKDIVFLCDDGSGGNTAYLTLDGGAGFMIANKKMRFLDSAAAAFGDSDDLQIYHDGNTSIRNDTGNLSIINRADDGDIIFQSDDGSGGVATYLTLDGGLGYTTVQKQIKFDDSVAATFGASGDFYISHNGSYTSLMEQTDDLYISNSANDKDIIFRSDDGNGGLAIYFYLDGSSATHDGSATTALYTNWPDKSYISLGTSHDLQLVHTGVNSVIQNLVGKLQITSHTDDIEIIQYANDKDIIFQSDDGSGGVATYFFLDGSSATGSNEYTVWPDSSNIAIGTGKDLQLYHNGSTSSIYNNTGDLVITNAADDGDIIFQSDDGSGGVATYFALDGGAALTKFYKDVKHLDSVKSTFGDSSDLQIYHNGSNSYIDETGTGSLFIRGDATVEIKSLAQDEHYII